MTPEDSAFWQMESDVSCMHNVTLAVFQGPVPSMDELTSHVGRRVALVPRLRQRVVPVPFDLARPVWVDDPRFVLDDHLAAAECGSGMAGLRELVSLILSQRLDRDRPLWQLNLVTGLPDDRWALISKVHHCLIDGVSGTDLLAVLVDDAADDASWVPSWDPSALPTPRDLVRHALLELALDPTEQYRAFRANAKRGRREWNGVTRRPVTLPSDPTGLIGPVGPKRSWAPAVVRMDVVRALRDRHRVGTHDVVLALVTSGLQALVLAHDEGSVPQPDVRAVVPIAVADDRAANASGIDAAVVELPTGDPDVSRQLRRIHEQRAADTAGGVAGSALTRLPGFAAPALASLGLREAARSGNGMGAAQAVVVNVPGPSRDLTVLGRTMIETYPVMPLPPRVRVTVGVVSYADHFTFGVTTDRDALPDGQVVATGIERTAAAIMSGSYDETAP